MQDPHPWILYPCTRPKFRNRTKRQVERAHNSTQTWNRCPKRPPFYFGNTIRSWTKCVRSQPIGRLYSSARVGRHTGLHRPWRTDVRTRKEWRHVPSWSTSAIASQEEVGCIYGWRRDTAFRMRSPVWRLTAKSEGALKTPYWLFNVHHIPPEVVDHLAAKPAVGRRQTRVPGQYDHAVRGLFGKKRVGIVKPTFASFLRD